MSSALRLVYERLPLVGRKAECLYGRDEVFRELCDEYEVCVKAVAGFQASKESDPGLREEYLLLRLRLERELLRYIEDHPNE